MNKWVKNEKWGKKFGEIPSAKIKVKEDKGEVLGGWPTENFAKFTPPSLSIDIFELHQSHRPMDSEFS